MNEGITDVHLLNVQMAFKSPDFRIDAEKLVNEKGGPHARPEQLIEELLSLDLIERGDDGKDYFLSEYGMEVAENGIPVDEDELWTSPYSDKPTSDIAEEESLMERIQSVPRIPLLIGFAIIFAFGLNYIRKNQEPDKPRISQEVLDNMVEDVQKQLDSIQSVEEGDSRDEVQ